MGYFFKSNGCLYSFTAGAKFYIDVPCLDCHNKQAPEFLREANYLITDIENHKCEAGSYRLMFSLNEAIEEIIGRYSSLSEIDQISLYKERQPSIEFLKDILRSALYKLEQIKFIE